MNEKVADTVEFFTRDDAAALMTIARRAPLQNMDEATAVSDLLQKFADFMDDYLPDGNDHTGRGV